jgi:hypothetical protein
MMTMVPPHLGQPQRELGCSAASSPRISRSANGGKILHDEDLAAAILERILERGRFIHLDGPSRRTRHQNLVEALPVAVRTCQNFRNPPPFD